MKTYRLHLIRNLPSEGNLQGRYIGRTESPLAMSEIPKLLELKEKYGYPRATAFYASPSTRCVDTLKLIYPEADPEVVLELAECDFGDWENRTAEELKDEPGFLDWLKGGGTSAPPEGESSAVFVRRVCEGFELLLQNIMAKGETDAVLLTSAGVITSVLAAFGIPEAKPLDWICSPGCGYSLRITPSIWMRSRLFEVVCEIPGGEAGEGPDHLIIDLAREAADRAYPGDDEEHE